MLAISFSFEMSHSPDRSADGQHLHPTAGRPLHHAGPGHPFPIIRTIVLSNKTPSMHVHVMENMGMDNNSTTIVTKFPLVNLLIRIECAQAGAHH